MTENQATSSRDYFTEHLNYTLANEDASMEIEMLRPNLGLVASIAGSGSRVLPLLSQKPERLAAIDVSPYQLYLTEMRVEATRSLEHEDFLILLGYAQAHAQKRKKIFESLSLSANAKTFMYQVFERHAWNSILYLGKWEKTFQKLSKVNRMLTGKCGEALFESRTLQEQLHYIEKDFPKLRWALVLFLIGNSSVFNSLLYSGDFPKKNIPQSFLSFYKERFQRLFINGVARENYFLQLCFFGEIRFIEGAPIEAHRAVFEKSKLALKDGCAVSYLNGNVFDVMKLLDGVDFFSFSDVPSYFTGETEQKYLQWLRPQLSKEAMVVIRHYLHITENTDKTGFTNVTDEFSEAIRREKLAVYDIEVLMRG